MRTNQTKLLARTLVGAKFVSCWCIAAVFAGTGCSRSPDAKPFDTVSRNASAVEQSAATKVAEVQQQPNSNDYTVTLARAEGEHNVALQKCETLSGQDQKTCKANADLDYDAAKANAKPTKPMQPVAPAAGSP